MLSSTGGTRARWKTNLIKVIFKIMRRTAVLNKCCPIVRQILIKNLEERSNWNRQANKKATMAKEAILAESSFTHVYEVLDAQLLYVVCIWYYLKAMK